jgi:hypothetical protein
VYKTGTRTHGKEGRKETWTEERKDVRKMVEREEERKMIGREEGRKMLEREEDDREGRKMI